jgi:hypothetical protein
MLVFPQLATGALTQYPLFCQDSIRVVSNSLGDGRSTQYLDVGGGVREWRLSVEEVTDAEWAAIAALHEAAEGRLRTFTLLDPSANLLAWSEDCGAADWHRDSGLTAQGGVADVWGGTGGQSLVNTAQGAQRVTQTLAAPGAFVYCFSAYARSTAGSSITLVRGTSSDAFRLSGTWTRVFTSGPAGAGDTAAFGLELAPGASLEVCGLLLEAQGAPGAYRPSRGKSGVFSRVRFADDQLTVRGQALNVHSATIRLVTNE